MHLKCLQLVWGWVLSLGSFDFGDGLGVDSLFYVWTGCELVGKCFANAIWSFLRWRSLLILVGECRVDLAMCKLEMHIGIRKSAFENFPR